jgi:Fe-S-cluster-containing dehydrogenase component
MERRDFLKLTAASGLLIAADGLPAQASGAKELAPGAVGLLYDATLCIGCKACVASCKAANSVPGGALWSEGMKQPPYEAITGEPPIWDAASDLTGRTVNIIKAYRGGAGAKDTEGGYSFVKQQCMHCTHAACVSACPVSAMIKDPQTGIVTYNKDACIGCRYCQIACPFLIPRFEWDQAFPQIRKCQLCTHRLKENKYSACAEACPVGATVYGKTADLRAEAERRLALAPGSYYEYPLNHMESGRRVRSVVANYQKHAYGLHEVGGTQCLVLSGVPFDKIGLPNVPDAAYAAKSETLQHTLYKGMIAPGILLAGLLFAAYKSSQDHE